MTKYRRKPEVVEAVKWEGDFIVDGKDTAPNWVNEALEEETLLFCNQGELYVVAPGTTPTWCPVGYYLVRNSQGEVYLCKPDIFEQTYEEVCDA